MQRQVLLLIALAACGKSERAKPTGPAFDVQATAAPCKAGETCTLSIRLTANGPYHVNDQYPFKFVPEETTSIVYEVGAFALDGETAGTMTVPFHAGAGAAVVAGKLRLSVCSADECLIEEAPVSVEVPVS